MSRYLLDTDILIDYSKGKEPAVSRIKQFIEQGDDLGVCAISVAEFFAGLRPEQRAYWRQVFSTLTYWEISPAAAQQAGQWRYDFLSQGTALSTADTLTAAVAVEQGATLLTANAKDYPMPEVNVLALR